MRASFTLDEELIQQLKQMVKQSKSSASELVARGIEQLTSDQLDSNKLLFNFTKLKSSLDKIASRYGIKKLSLFGSVLHGNQHADSDIDLLVEFNVDRQVGMFDLVNLEQELSVLLQGKKVDLRTKNDLSKFFRAKVVEEAVPIYGV